MAPIPYGRQLGGGPPTSLPWTEVSKGDWLTQGPAVEAFEQAVAAYCEVPHAVAFSSGTAALHGAAFVARLMGGDELITSAITFAASANCGAYVWATPRFADIDPATFDELPRDRCRREWERGRRRWCRSTSAAFPRRCERYARRLATTCTISPTRPTRSARWPNRGLVGACGHADMTAFSFHPVKPVTSCEGGMVTTRDRPSSPTA